MNLPIWSLFFGLPISSFIHANTENILWDQQSSISGIKPTIKAGKWGKLVKSLINRTCLQWKRKYFSFKNIEFQTRLFFLLFRTTRLILSKLVRNAILMITPHSILFSYQNRNQRSTWETQINLINTLMALKYNFFKTFRKMLF